MKDGIPDDEPGNANLPIGAIGVARAAQANGPFGESGVPGNPGGSGWAAPSPGSKEPTSPVEGKGFKRASHAVAWFQLCRSMCPQGMLPKTEACV
jgi:hypothetical protein